MPVRQAQVDAQDITGVSVGGGVCKQENASPALGGYFLLALRG